MFSLLESFLERSHRGPQGCVSTMTIHLSGFRGVDDPDIDVDESGVYYHAVVDKYLHAPLTALMVIQSLSHGIGSNPTY